MVQEPVADLASLGVVDVFEMTGVHQHDHHPGQVELALCDVCLQIFLESGADT